MKTSRFFRIAAAMALLAGGACLAAESYVYTAQKYDPTADCVNASKPIEVVKGSGASATCPAACLMVGEDLYVSTLCPPLPTIATAVDRDAGDCVAALAAAARGGTCDAPLAIEGGADAARGDADAADEAAAADDAGGDAATVDAAEAGPVKDAGDAG
jgi:hypothetical protein